MKQKPIASSWQDMRRVIAESIGLIGFWMTVRYMLIYLLSYKPFNDRSFDRRHGTDTGGMVPTVDLDIDDESTKWQSNLYLGSPDRVTRHLIRTLSVRPAEYTFIDYGSGKGRVLFAAPFQGYGPTAVLHHAGRVFTLYAGLDHLEVAENDVVALGDVIGASSERFYFEIRVENKAEDPLSWLR